MPTKDQLSALVDEFAQSYPQDSSEELAIRAFGLFMLAKLATRERDDALAALARAKE